MSDSGACCNGPAGAEEIDRALANPPGRSELSYRLGTHGTFLRRMLAALPAQTIPNSNPPVRPLAALDTRAADDPAIALIDAWAVTADVLTFYQERIANEGFVRTATERRSVLELARAVGYELAPGVAASAHLAFTVEDTTPVAKIPKGARVQSLPGQDQVPQTFETSEEIEARAEWNKLRPRRTQPQDLGISESDKLCFVKAEQVLLEAPDALPSALYLKGTSTNLRVGDLLLVHREAGGSGSAFAGTTTVTVHRIVPEPSAGRTRVEIDSKSRAIPEGLLPPAGTTEPPDADRLQESILTKSIREESLRAQLTLLGRSGTELTKHIQHALLSPGQTSEVFALRQRMSFFGHDSRPITDKPLPPIPDKPDSVEDLAVWTTAFTDAFTRLKALNDLVIWKDSTKKVWPAEVHAFLERPVPELVSGGWVVFKDPTASTLAAGLPFRIKSTVEMSVADYGITLKTTGLILENPDGTAPDTNKPFGVRTSTALVQSERLELSELPLEDAIGAGAVRIALDRFVLGLRAGQPVWISGERDDLPGVVTSEIAVLAGVVHDHGHTTLVFQNGLRHPYIRETVTINANVAPATHGETVAREVLGSGDGSKANQRFVLNKPNLTFLSAPTQSGVASTVSIRVNDVLWREVPSLFGQDAGAQVYMLSIGDDGRTTVLFGDGRNGARLPTGQENVAAEYRTGVMTAGAVDAGTLTLLQTRPLGIRSVTNPLPSTGAEGPDSLEEGRVNAPFAVLTLDRAVTLQDYEDFVRAFGGIGKAKAAAISTGRGRIVHVTAVSDRGTPIDPQSELFKNLRKALFEASDPGQEVQIDGARVRTFTVQASLVLDPRRISTQVLANASAALRSAFSLARRDLGQDVMPAEVITVLQRVPGVVAALLERLAIVGEPEPLELVTLFASPATFIAGRVQSAELLLLDPAGIALTEVSA